MSLLVDKVESQIEKYMSDLIGQAMTQALIDGDHEFFRRYDKYISPRLGLKYIYQLSLEHIKQGKLDCDDFRSELEYSLHEISCHTEKIKNDDLREKVDTLLEDFGNIPINVGCGRLKGESLSTELSEFCDITQEILQDERWEA